MQRVSANMIFDLQVGQFLGARGDFVPMPICQQLSRLHDQVVGHFMYAGCCTCACQSPSASICIGSISATRQADATMHQNLHAM